jgi:hypothetical protein
VICRRNEKCIVDDMKWLTIIFQVIRDLFRSRASLEAEIVCLRQQLAVYKAKVKRPILSSADRRFWIVMSLMFRSLERSSYYRQARDCAALASIVSKKNLGFQIRPKVRATKHRCLDL